MNDYADLEIGLHRRTAGTYAVELRFSHPNMPADLRISQGDDAPVEFDLAALKEAAGDLDSYGSRLTAQLFADPKLSSGYREAFRIAESMGAGIRLRIYISPSAQELHEIYWECLHDPIDMTLLSTSERVIFSRYLSSFDWQPIPLKPLHDLKALVVIANPSGLDEYQLAPLQVESELQRVRTGLAGLPMVELASPGTATLENILAQLREQDCSSSSVIVEEDTFDVLYLVCHGATAQGQPWLLLEDSEGKAQLVAGREFVKQLGELRRRPRIAILASCQSAGVLTALGPQLAAIGVSAVIAMQGSVSVATVDEFMPVFFHELRRDGQIDRAMAVARQKIRARADWWMPVLYMRLRMGRIWYVPGFGDESQGREKLPALIQNIRIGRCTPIIGMGVVDRLLGTQREIALAWAASYNFPLAPHSRDDLPQVAQYLAVIQDELYPRSSLQEYLRSALVARFRHTALDAWDDERCGKSTIQEIISVIGNYIWDRDPHDPVLALAGWPISTYINTTPGNMLLEALRRVGKKPQVEICRWNSFLAGEPSIFEHNPSYVPSVQEPLVYQLFGNFDNLDSLVLTEDDYFRFLMGSAFYRKNVFPKDILAALVNNSLLFLGFNIEDWNFRVLLRSILDLEGSSLSSRFAHVAAQIAPLEGRLQDPQRANQFLQKEFLNAHVSVYWGSAAEFTDEICAKLAAS